MKYIILLLAITSLLSATELAVIDSCIPMASLTELTFEEGRKIKKTRKEQDDLQLMCDGESCRHGVINNIVCQQTTTGRFACDGEEISRGKLLRLREYEITCDSCEIPRQGYIRNDSCILRYSIETTIVDHQL